MMATIARVKVGFMSWPVPEIKLKALKITRQIFPQAKRVINKFRVTQVKIKRNTMSEIPKHFLTDMVKLLSRLLLIQDHSYSDVVYRQDLRPYGAWTLNSVSRFSKEVIVLLSWPNGIKNLSFWSMNPTWLSSFNAIPSLVFVAHSHRSLSKPVVSLAKSRYPWNLRPSIWYPWQTFVFSVSSKTKSQLLGSLWKKYPTLDQNLPYQVGLDQSLWLPSKSGHRYGFFHQKLGDQLCQMRKLLPHISREQMQWLPKVSNPIDSPQTHTFSSPLLLEAFIQNQQPPICVQ